LACPEPIAKGLQITHWTSKDLARQAIEDGIVPSLSDRTVRMILNQVDLQPHRTRDWRTARIDPEFKRRAEKVLWCYANADRLTMRGYWVVCVDEKPNCQVLERHPIRRPIPGSIEQKEFESYNRKLTGRQKGRDESIPCVFPAEIFFSPRLAPKALSLMK
jgi:hypothetical protein